MCFFKRNLKHIILLTVFVAVVFIAMALADGIQRGFGKINVSVGTLSVDYRTMDGESQTGVIGYKLYVPKTANAANKAGAVLLLHGYQNDRETSAAFALELARRGLVVLSIDEFGHGASDIGCATAAM